MLTDTETERSLRRRAGLPRRKANRRSGAHGNGKLTALAGLLLLPLLAVEGATVPWISRLLSVHIFVGMLLLGPVVLKLGATGYRVVRYYGRSTDYVERGPPAPLMRLIVAPILVLSTAVLFSTGVILLVSPGRGLVLLLHKASFIVWFGALSIHVLAYAVGAARTAVERVPQGGPLRLVALLGALAAGVGVALLTYHLAGPWFHSRLR